jgi:hypothetical protein
MSKLSSDTLELIKSLGVPENTCGIQLTLEAGKLPEMRIVRHLDHSVGLEMFPKVSENFVLVRKDEWTFKSIKDFPPPTSVFVEVMRDSGYITLPYEILTAQYVPDYKGWTKPSNDRLTDSGSDPTHWRPLPDLYYLK